MFSFLLSTKPLTNPNVQLDSHAMGIWFVLPAFVEHFNQLAIEYVVYLEDAVVVVYDEALLK